MKRFLFYLAALSSIGFLNAQTPAGYDQQIQHTGNSGSIMPFEKPANVASVTSEQPDIYGFTVETIDGEQFSMSQLKGKKVMIANVASKCGLTPQYKQLQELYDRYKDKNFVIVGFPANNFGSQEPGTNEEIKGFCTMNYGVTFPMMAKISVKGDDIAPIYQWLTAKTGNGVSDAEVTWNFQKFLIDEKGHWVKTIAPKESPVSEEVINWIER